LPHIEELIEFGEIVVGNKYPIGGVAVASHEHNALAMLVCRDGETLAQLLSRLDQAVAKALDEDIYTDEINPSSWPLSHPHNQSCPLRKLVDTTTHSTTTDYHLPDGQKDTLTLLRS
jgi:hypothetical protein